MARVKVWQPVNPEDLPLNLKESLRLANGSKSKRRLVVCEQVVVEVDSSSGAEVARLKEQIKILERVLDRRKKEVNLDDIYNIVKDTILKGQTISCSKQQWSVYRQALQRTAKWATDNNQPIYANIALNEIKRLDRLHNYGGDKN